MSWLTWADKLRRNPEEAVSDLLHGVANINPFERITPHEFLLAVLPRSSRSVNRNLLGDPSAKIPESSTTADLPALLDKGLVAWLLKQRGVPLPAARKLSAYAAQVCEALQWPVYFNLPSSFETLKTERARWLPWFSSLTITAYRDPEYDYWQVFAAKQSDDSLQFDWRSFVVEAGRTRSNRYLNLGLLALARLPLSEQDSLRNLRLQVQALLTRYQRRKSWGKPALEELVASLRQVMARNLSMGMDKYQTFLSELLQPLGEQQVTAVLEMLFKVPAKRQPTSTVRVTAALSPPTPKHEVDKAVQSVNQSSNLMQAWGAISGLLIKYETYLRRSGETYNFVTTLDRCVRAFCNKYTLTDPEIQRHVFQWIYIALRVDANNPRLWMLWQLALRQARQRKRSQWVLWEMTRRFPEQLPCRVELARQLAESGTADEQAQSRQLLQQVLAIDPSYLHAHSTLAQLAIHRDDWDRALTHANNGLQVDPDNESCAVLQAAAYKRRDGPGDLQTAIDQLQQYLKRNPNKQTAKDYLNDLLKRQQHPKQVRQDFFKVEAGDTGSGIADRPETDPAWTAFAESINTWVAATAPSSSITETSFSNTPDGRVLPLFQALHDAVTSQHFDDDILDSYDDMAKQEFPLETRLWRYLQSLHQKTDVNDTKKLVDQWLENEKEFLQKEKDTSWLTYLNQRWNNIQTSGEINTVAIWLRELLDRYPPLPAVLLTDYSPA